MVPSCVREPGTIRTGQGPLRSLIRCLVASVLALAAQDVSAQVSYGTAFSVAPELLITNRQVTAGCTSITVISPDGRRTGSVVDTDAQRDLVLLRVVGLKGLAARLRIPRQVREGESVRVFGFPRAGALSISGSLTSGLVSAVRSPGGTTGEMQIRAPVQPGFGGGPLLDVSGLVIGVTGTKPDVLPAASTAGEGPENVNPAISLEALADFLARNKVPLNDDAAASPLDHAELAAAAQKLSYRIECRVRTLQAAASPAQALSDERVRLEAERARSEAEQKAKAEALRKDEETRREQAARDAAMLQARREAEAKAQAEAEEKARLVAEAARSLREERARLEADEKTRAQALRKDEDAKRNAELAARAAAEFRARRESEEKAKAENEHRARQAAEEARKSAQERAAREAEQKAKAEAAVVVLNGRKISVCPGSYLAAKWTRCFGERTFPDGSKYAGEFNDGIRNGQGTLTLPSGQTYIGEYKNDRPNGQGALTYANGQKFVGEFRDGKSHGRGSFTLPSGQHYVGEFRNGKYHGHGIFTSPDGTRYVGEFRDGKSQGQGTLTFRDGEKYVGSFRDGKSHGRGTLTYPDGETYVGEFRDDQLHGRGDRKSVV